jgi:hypothetical protein
MDEFKSLFANRSNNYKLAYTDELVPTVIYLSQSIRTMKCVRNVGKPCFKSDTLKRSCLRETIMYCGVQDNIRDIKQY